MNSQPPVRKPDIHTKDLGTETLLYSAKFGAIHILNPTAKCIWEMCDGQHTMEEMAHILRVGFVVADSEDVIGDIQRILEVLAQKELLQQTEKARGPAA